MLVRQKSRVPSTGIFTSRVESRPPCRIQLDRKGVTRVCLHGNLVHADATRGPCRSRAQPRVEGRVIRLGLMSGWVWRDVYDSK